MHLGLDQQKLAVDSGQWLLYRYDPRRSGSGHAKLQIDSPAPKIPVRNYLENELRFRVLEKTDLARYKALQEAAQTEVANRFEFYKHLASIIPERNGQ